MSEKKQICEDCGTENAGFHKFCSDCGNYLLDDTHQNLPKNVAAAVQKLETRLSSDYKSPFWSKTISQPIFMTASAYLGIGFLYLLVEFCSGFYLGGYLSWVYVLLRAAELSLPVYLAMKIKDKSKNILYLAAGLLWLFYIISFWL
jgi:hypothetical protein